LLDGPPYQHGRSWRLRIWRPGRRSLDSISLKFWEWTMWQIVQLVMIGVLAAVFGLSALSRRYPHVGWLQPFRFNWPQLPEEQRERMRRRANVHAGIELILLGFAVPIVYVGSSIMMFNDPTARGLTISIAIAALLIALGITGVWRNARRRTDRDLRG
jgi:hypothetical protein